MQLLKKKILAPRLRTLQGWSIIIIISALIDFIIIVIIVSHLHYSGRSLNWADKSGDSNFLSQKPFVSTHENIIIIIVIV